MKLYKFLKLSGADRWLLIETFALLAAVQLGLYFLPFQTLRRFLDRLITGWRSFSFTAHPAAARIPWAVRMASGYIPKSTCLPQALVTHFLLLRHGYPADLKIGAAKKADGTLEAHAWVVSEQQIVIGALHDLDRYILLSAVPRKG